MKSTRILVAVALCSSCGVREIDLNPNAGPTPGIAPAPVVPVGGSGGAGGVGSPSPSPVTPRLDAATPPVSGGGRTDAAAGTDAARGSTQPPPATTTPPPATTSPPVSGVGVTINGTFVPKEKAIVLLHLGHSNMAGRAHDPVSLMPYFFDTDPHLWQYRKGGVWVPAREPLSGDGGTPGVRPSNQGAGPGMALLRRALALAPDAYIISIGQGMSLDFGTSCFTFRKGGLFYDKVGGVAVELKGKVTFGGLFTMLGYDARTAAAAQNGGFLACLQGMAADFRADLGAPNMPFVPGDYERGAIRTYAPTCCGAPQVIAQLAQVPMVITDSFLIPSDGLQMQDDHHYNMAGHRDWADRAFQGMAAKGLLPWATVK
jgi:Carbohydrate esterase, sialic acid-specific acetylesterase